MRCASTHKHTHTCKPAKRKRVLRSSLSPTVHVLYSSPRHMCVFAFESKIHDQHSSCFSSSSQNSKKLRQGPLCLQARWTSPRWRTSCEAAATAWPRTPRASRRPIRTSRTPRKRTPPPRPLAFVPRAKPHPPPSAPSQPHATDVTGKSKAKRPQPRRSPGLGVPGITRTRPCAQRDPWRRAPPYLSIYLIIHLSNYPSIFVSLSLSLYIYIYIIYMYM